MCLIIHMTRLCFKPNIWSERKERLFKYMYEYVQAFITCLFLNYSKYGVSQKPCHQTSSRCEQNGFGPTNGPTHFLRVPKIRSPNLFVAPGQTWNESRKTWIFDAFSNQQRYWPRFLENQFKPLLLQLVNCVHLLPTSYQSHLWPNSKCTKSMWTRSVRTSSQASKLRQSETITDWVTQSLTGVKHRATSVAKNF